MHGSAGMQFFNETIVKVEGYKQLFARKHKLQLAALKRRAIKHDLLSDWQPLVDKLLAIWEDAIGVDK